MFELNEQFANHVSDACITTYNSLGKSGKPQKGREWTKMACMVKSDGVGNIEVLTLATGTKCLGEKMRNKEGTILNDSHAEILARRLLLKYFFKQLELALDPTKESIFVKSDDTELYMLKNDVFFHLFTTDVPCGDASIFTTTNSDVHAEESTKRKNTDISSNPKRQKTDCNDSKTFWNNGNHGYEKYQSDANGTLCSDVTPTSLMSQSMDNETVELRTNTIDIHRTGAKCVPKGEIQDLLGPGVLYHRTGALRIKPGRGHRTISMSCSDKIMKWCVLGLTGGLLQNFIKDPIFLSSIIVSNDDFNRASLTRAISFRERNVNDKLTIQLPKILHCKVKFPDGLEALHEHSNPLNNKVTPVGTTILWCKTCSITEVSTMGRKHGFNKKDLNSSKANTSICKKNLFRDFRRFLELSGQTSKFQHHSKYHDCKHARSEYRTMRTSFFQVFADWMNKSEEEEQFRLDGLDHVISDAGYGN